MYNCVACDCHIHADMGICVVPSSVSVWHDMARQFSWLAEVSQFKKLVLECGSDPTSSSSRPLFRCDESSQVVSCSAVFACDCDRSIASPSAEARGGDSFCHCLAVDLLLLLQLPQLCKKPQYLLITPHCQATCCSFKL